MTGPDRTPDTELAGLPAWLYPAGFWVAVLLLAAGVLFPDLAVWGVAWVGLVPVLAAAGFTHLYHLTASSPRYPRG